MSPETANFHKRSGDDRRTDHTRQNKYERLRTMIFAVLVAGVVSLTIVRISEVSSANDQIERSRVNCQLIQDDRKDRAEALNAQADPILGNKEKNIPRANFDVPPYSKFSDFKDLIVSQAIANRKRATLVAKRVENCNQVFPKRELLPFVEP